MTRGSLSISRSLTLSHLQITFLPSKVTCLQSPETGMWTPLGALYSACHGRHRMELRVCCLPGPVSLRLPTHSHGEQVSRLLPFYLLVETGLSSYVLVPGSFNLQMAESGSSSSSPVSRLHALSYCSLATQRVVPREQPGAGLKCRISAPLRPPETESAL